jgi:hypothetical protein
MTGRTADDQSIAATFNEQMAIGAGLIAVAVIIHCIGLFTLRRLILSENRGVPIAAGRRCPSRAGCSRCSPCSR